MSEQAATKASGKKGQDRPQVNMLLYEDDRLRLEHLLAVTGVVSQTETLRYALKFAADRHLVSPPTAGDITPALIHDIAGLTSLLKAFVMAVASRMGRETPEYRQFVMGLLANIGDPTEICALLAEQFPEETVVLRYSHATHLQYEYATECLVQQGISLDERLLDEAEQHLDLGRKAFRLYLDDLYAVYADLVNRYHSPGAYASFVSRLHRYARGMLHAFFEGAAGSSSGRELSDGQAGM
jgi:hypothetical protein